MDNRAGLYVKVGLFVLVSALVAAYLIITFDKDRFAGETKTYVVYFDDAAGLSKGADVNVKGVKAGRVKDLGIENTKVKVIVAVKKDVPIYRDARAYIKTMGLMGDKYVYINPGNPQTGELPPNSVIANTKVYPSTEDTFSEIALAAKKFQMLMDNLNRALGDGKLERLITDVDRLAVEAQTVVAENRENLKKSIENIAYITESLKKELPTLITKIEKVADNLEQITGSNKEDIRRLVVALRETAEILREKAPETIDNINEAALEAKSILQENHKDINVAIKNIEESSKKLNQILTKLNEGKGTLGKLINEDDMYNNINEGIKSFSKPFQVIDESKLYVSIFSEAHSGNDDRKAGIGLTLMPNYDRYIYVALLSNSNGNVTKVEEKYSNNVVYKTTTRTLGMLVDLQYARQLIQTQYGNLWVRAGLKESSGDIGLEWWFKDNLRLTSDLYKFSRKYEWDKPSKPELDVGMYYRLEKTPLFFKVGGSDLLVDKYRGIYIGAGLRFSDNYLKYMLGLINTPGK